MDVLSDVLMSVRLTGAVFFSVDARSPFVTEAPSIAAMGDQLVAGAEHVIAFHVVTEGTCWAESLDHAEPPVSLQAGDMVAFPGGDANVMESAPGMRGRPDPRCTSGRRTTSCRSTCG
ncbi:cupin domain-containing protein [Oerskovia sp. M15]